MVFVVREFIKICDPFIHDPQNTDSHVPTFLYLY